MTVDYNPELVAGMGSYVRSATGIIAQADGTKANATPLNYGVSEITVSAGAADSVLLPPAKPRGMCVLINRGGNTVQVFGQGTDTVNEVATATGVTMADNEIAILVCGAEGSWSGGVMTAF